MDSAGPLALRRLTQSEYNATVRVLLGDTVGPATAWTPDIRAEWGFATAPPTSVNEAGGMREAAVALASQATVNLDGFLGCAIAADEIGCVRGFVTRFGRRAYRRPLDAAEVSALLALYQKIHVDIGLGARQSVEHVVQAMLQSPSFLYRWDLASMPRLSPSGLVALDSFTLASRLSYLLLGSMPDPTLEQLADAGRLDSTAAVEAQAERLLGLAAARPPLVSFVSQWLELDRTRGTDAQRKSMAAETSMLLAAVVFEGDRKLDTLLTSPTAFVNADLAAIYGMPGITGTQLRPVSLDPTRRMGLLTRAAFLSASAGDDVPVPPARGALILNRLLCGQMPDPPANVPEPQPPARNVTTRERFERHAQNPCATACHSIIDPPGFAFGNYDGTGRYVQTDGGKPVDASGEMQLPMGERFSFRDGPEFIGRIARSADLHQCLVRNWFRFMLGRNETSRDEAGITRTAGAFAQSGFDLRSLILESVQTTPFLQRSPAEGEVLR